MIQGPHHLLLLFVFATALKQLVAGPVNVLLIVADDLGYNDLSSYGSPTIETPHIDGLASSGARFTQFYTGAPVCTPSRSAMLTGRLPVRSGIYCNLAPPADELFRVFYPTSEGCLPESEVTIGDALKESYATAMIGKWHLGHNKDEPCLPGNGNQGFDAFFGIPYSHEEGYPGPMPEGLVFPPVPLMSTGYTFVEQPFNESDLTSRYTELVEGLIEQFAIGQGTRVPDEAVTTVSEDLSIELDFQKPFFMHIGYENPHVPLFLSEDYTAQSRRGLYGDSVQEMDISIGRIISAVEKNGLAENTLIMFTSDNGAWINPSNGLNPNRQVFGMGPFDGGCNAPFKEGKGSTWEGGFRVPFVVSLPGTIPGNQIIRTPITAMDIMPTILDYAGIPPPKDTIFDGKSVRQTLQQGDSSGPVHECIYLWREKDLYAIRCGQYKAHFITRSGFDFSDEGTFQDPPLLFNVEWDPSEAIPLDVTDPTYAVELKKLTLQADIHLSTVDKASSQYLAQNMSRVPCCPRDSPEDVNLPDGPWKDCICTRISV